MAKMVKVDEENFFEIDAMLDEIKHFLFPVSLYDKRLKKAYDRVLEVIDIFYDCKDMVIPIKQTEREIRYAITDLRNYLHDNEENDGVFEYADMLMDVFVMLSEQEGTN